MVLDEAGRIIKIAVFAQIYDRMFQNELDELANEAWVEVLPVLRKSSGHVPAQWVYLVAKRAIIHFKQWQRCSLTVPRTHPHDITKWRKPVELVALALDEWNEAEAERHLKHRDPFEDLVDFYQVFGKVRGMVSREYVRTMELILSGYSRIEVWQELRRQKVKAAKHYPYNLPDLRDIWESFGVTKPLDLS